MKRLFLAVASSFALVLAAGASFAAPPDATHAPIGAGFHDVAAPLGIRWWLSGQKVGIDAGLGFASTPSGIDPNENELGWTLDLGVPLVMHSWSQAHVLFRPGILYTSQEVGFDSDPGTGGVQFDTDDATTFVLQGELEAEVFLRDNVSFSASTGIAYQTFNPALGGDSETTFQTLGRNFTNIGFHVYFLGGKR